MKTTKQNAHLETDTINDTLRHFYLDEPLHMLDLVEQSRAITLIINNYYLPQYQKPLLHLLNERLHLLEQIMQRHTLKIENIEDE